MFDFVHSCGPFSPFLLCMKVCVCMYHGVSSGHARSDTLPEVLWARFHMQCLFRV